MLILISIIIFILLFILVAVLTFARDLLVTILNAVIVFFRKITGRYKDEDPQVHQTVRKRSRSRNKVLSDSDGEYVDFEEVKK